MACRGEPREGVKATVDGRMRGVAFDTMRDECGDQLEAMGEWTELVQQSAGAGFDPQPQR